MFDDPEAPVAARFRLSAEASPGLLPRLLAPFARRDLCPDAVRAARRGGLMQVEFALAAMPAGEVHPVEGNLRQVVGVSAVEVEIGRLRQVA
jgi:hypothetical protein